MTAWRAASYDRAYRGEETVRGCQR